MPQPPHPKSKFLAIAVGEQRIEEMVRMLGGGGSEVRAMAESLLSR